MLEVGQAELEVDLSNPNVRLVMDAVSQKLADVPVSKAQKASGLIYVGIGGSVKKHVRIQAAWQQA